MVRVKNYETVSKFVKVTQRKLQTLLDSAQLGFYEYLMGILSG